MKTVDIRPSDPGSTHSVNVEKGIQCPLTVPVLQENSNIARDVARSKQLSVQLCEDEFHDRVGGAVPVSTTCGVWQMRVMYPSR